MEKEIFTIDFNGKKINADIISENGQAEVLILHGAGGSNKARYENFRESLATSGISSCAFDFIGHGETGGDLKDTSLIERTEEALSIISNLNIKKPLRIIGFSMGAYVAIKITEVLPVENMILFVPAVYNSKAYTLKFGEGFSEAIRALNSWHETDAWEILRKYRHKVLIFKAENDETIPSDLVTKIYNSLENSKFKKIVTLPNATHSMKDYFKQSPANIISVVREIEDFLKK